MAQTPTVRNALVAIKVVGLSAVLLLTNQDLFNNVPLLIERRQFGTLLPFIAIWLVTLLAVFGSAFHPKLWVRALWGVIIAASTAVIWGYYQASHSQLSLLDALSFWDARHEAGRASDFYAKQITLAEVMFAAVAILFLLPASQLLQKRKLLSVTASLLPIFPILMITAVFWAKNGVTYMSMPSQFDAPALAALVTYKEVTQKTSIRQNVQWQPAQHAATRNIIFLVDESVRADYIDLAKDNPFTPNFAALSDRFVNFGPAASGGNCSNYANALLRFGASRENIANSASTNATLFQYAKKAGFRTVFIDAQAGNFALGNMLQNFMTLKEKADIDGFYPLRDVPAAMADREMIKIIAKELQSSQPVFIYANKNGSHFPYDHAYPATASKFHPSMTELGADTKESRVASYRNAIAWSVDDFMKIFFDSVDMSASTMIYTSDHGQMLEPGKLTHCMVDNPGPMTGYVPLMVYSSDQVTHARFVEAVTKSKGKASHFQIAPTLYELMGYSRSDIQKNYDESLFDGTARAPEMTTGDIFGVFGSEIKETLIPLGGVTTETAEVAKVNP